jgi:hypothetical protein
VVPLIERFKRPMAGDFRDCAAQASDHFPLFPQQLRTAATDPIWCRRFGLPTHYLFGAILVHEEEVRSGS